LRNKTFVSEYKKYHLGKVHAGAENVNIVAVDDPKQKNGVLVHSKEA